MMGYPLFFATSLFFYSILFYSILFYSILLSDRYCYAIGFVDAGYVTASRV